MSRKRRTGWLLFAGLCVALVLVQGARHGFRLSPETAVQDCRTGEILDDGCSILGLCQKCYPICAEGTDSPLVAQTSCAD